MVAPQLSNSPARGGSTDTVFFLVQTILFAQAFKILAFSWLNSSFPLDFVAFPINLCLNIALWILNS